MQPKSYKGNTKANLEIRDFQGSRTNSIENKGRTKNFKKKRYLSGLYSNSNGLKIVYI